MNYSKIYDKIIKLRKETPIHKFQYGENHHIIPRCLGGTNNINNVVRLTAREHYICHLLLMKMYPEGTIHWIKMTKAFQMMQISSNNQKRYSNNRMYELLKIKFSLCQSISQSGEKNSQYGIPWIVNIATGERRKLREKDLPENWILSKEKSQNKKNAVKEEKNIKRKRIKEENSIKKQILEQKEKEEKILIKKEIEEKQANNWYNQLINSKTKSIREFVQKSSYQYSHVSFIKMLKKHVPEFNPQKGKSYLKYATLSSPSD